MWHQEAGLGVEPELEPIPPVRDTEFLTGSIIEKPLHEALKNLQIALWIKFKCHTFQPDVSISYVQVHVTVTVDKFMFYNLKKKSHIP